MNKKIVIIATTVITATIIIGTVLYKKAHSDSNNDFDFDVEAEEA